MKNILPKIKNPKTAAKILADLPEEEEEKTTTFHWELEYRRLRTGGLEATYQGIRFYGGSLAGLRSVINNRLTGAVVLRPVSGLHYDENK